MRKYLTTWLEVLIPLTIVTFIFVVSVGLLATNKNNPTTIHNQTNLKIKRIYDTRPGYDGIRLTDDQNNIFITLDDLAIALHSKGKCGICGK